MTSQKDREHIFERLRSGVVPERGLDTFAVGVDGQRKEIGRLLDLAASGEGVFKFLRGGYGCGKTFMARLAVHDAQARGFATSFVVVSDNDFHLHKFEDLYRRVVQDLGTSTCPRGALGDIIDRWIAKVETALIDGGADEDAPDFDDRVEKKIEEEIGRLTGGKAPEDLGRVLREIFKLKRAGKVREAGSLMSWLSGSENVSASEKKAAGIKGDITSTDAMQYLHGILEVVKAAGFKGLVIVVDEVETIVRMRTDVRGKSMNAIRQIIDAADRYKGLLWIFTGTPDFFDNRRTVAGLQPLHDRIKFQVESGLVSMRQPQLELRPFTRERLKEVGLRLRQLYPMGDPNIVAQKVTPEIIAAKVDEVTKGFGGDVGIVPRQFLRSLVNLFDVVAENPDAQLPEPPKTVVEQRAAEGKKPLEYDPEPDDEAGIASTSVEFLPMARTSDRDRLVSLLAETEGLSSARIKIELNLGDERYEQVRSSLIDDGLAEKYVCRGGGLRLTKKGEREVSPESEVESSVEREDELYAPLVEVLLREEPESVAFDTASLRKRGKWQNPDVTQVSVEIYPLVRRRRVLLTTYEVKQWGAWDVNAVFEAASHARFAHEGFVVLEWTEKTFSLSEPRLDKIVRECQRFGIGLATLEPYYKHYRLHTRLEPVSKTPSDADIEEWLDYALSRRADAMDRFQAIMAETEKRLRGI